MGGRAGGVHAGLLEVLVEAVVVLLEKVGAGVHDLARKVTHREVDVLPGAALGHHQPRVLGVRLVDRRAELEVGRLEQGGGGGK